MEYFIQQMAFFYSLSKTEMRYQFPFQTVNVFCVTNFWLKASSFNSNCILNQPLNWSTLNVCGLVFFPFLMCVCSMLEPFKPFETLKPIQPKLISLIVI